MENTTEKFIEIVKSHNILWDLTNPNYKNIKKKAAIWKQISEECGMTFEASKKKWKSLRDSFARDLGRKQTSGQGAEEPETKWKYHEQMDFLREHQKPRPTKSNIAPNVSEDLYEESVTGSGVRGLLPLTEDSFDFPPDLENTSNVTSPEGVRPVSSLSSHGPWKRHRTMEATFVSTMESVQEFLNKPRPAPVNASIPDEDDLFSQCIAAKIKKFPVNIKNQVKLEMLRYLNDIETSVTSD